VLNALEESITHQKSNVEIAVRPLLCGISKNQSNANTQLLKSEPFQSFVHIIDRKLPISGRFSLLPCNTINEENILIQRHNSWRTTRFISGETGWEDSTGGSVTHPILMKLNQLR